jgi:hypothetical protein
MALKDARRVRGRSRDEASFPKYMRAFAAAWPDAAIVPRVVARLPWRQNIALLERLRDAKTRLWYAQETLRNGWSQRILALQIEGRAHERRGKALSNFKEILRPAQSDMAAQVFKDPYLFDFLGTADTRREREVEQSLVDHIQIGRGRSAASSRGQTDHRTSPGQREEETHGRVRFARHTEADRRRALGNQDRGIPAGQS